MRAVRALLRLSSVLALVVLSSLAVASRGGAATTASGTAVTPDVGGTPAVLSVTPNIEVHNGTVVNVSGFYFHQSATGSFLECNATKTEPTVALDGLQVPVSCTSPTGASATTTTTGEIEPPQGFLIRTGQTGPPTSAATDSSGGSAHTDAASYPCPPTAAQLAAGASCEVAFVDPEGDDAGVDISFATSTVTTTTTTTTTAPATPSTRSTTPTTAPPATTTTLAQTASVSVAATATATPLAFTGPGPGVWGTAIGGLLLLDLGFLVLTAYYRPRQVAGLVGRTVVRLFGGR